MSILKFKRNSSETKRLIEEWEHSKVSLEQFLVEQQEWFKQILLGSNLSPEELEWKGITLAPDEMLHFMKDLKISQTRFGLRWRNVVDNNNQIDFSYYGPWLDALVENNIKICLNVGPIKTLRWPEDHVPSVVLNSLSSIPRNGSTIETNSELALRAFDYLNNLIDELNARYPNAFYTLQPENEPNSGFGEHDWRLSNDYLVNSVLTLHNGFPESSILLNCPATKNSWRGINEVLIESQQLDLTLQNKLISAINYYYRHPSARTFGQGFQADTVMAVGRNEVERQKRRLHNSGIKTCVSEMQLEPWGDFTTPGNVAHEFLFALMRSSQFLNLDSKNEIMLWGLEHLAQVKQDKNWNKEHEKIAETIREINTRFS